VTGYERVTEHEPAALAPTCHSCGVRTHYAQAADDRWTCRDCDPPHITDLRASLARAERALSDLEQSDDLCHVTGAWGRAHGLVLSIRRELADAEREAA
jgi:transposase